jgi:hypothetical protein
LTASVSVPPTTARTFWIASDMVIHFGTYRTMRISPPIG